MLLVDIGGYGYAVPCVPTDEGYFLKTVYPSRQGYPALSTPKEGRP
jgi:hypothetical protein